MSYKILVVDDEDDYQKVVRKLLEQTGQVVPAFTLAEADRELLKSTFDLILLDVGLPDGDGFTFYEKLLSQESTANIPVIFVTSRSDATNELMGFSLGAEDYVSKPIDPPRLKTRIEARLNLIKKRQQQEMALTKGNLRLSLTRQSAAVISEGKEIPVDLTPVEFKLLFHFLRHEDQVFTREQLLQAVWNSASEVFDRTVDMHISKLRKKISLSDFQIKAVHGTGYKLSKASAAPDQQLNKG
ncbi:MAG: response regulator transcription factor [Bdellovibrionota bacterium]